MSLKSGCARDLLPYAATAHFFPGLSSGLPHVTIKSTGEYTVIRVPAAIVNGGTVLSIISTISFCAT